MKSISDSAVHGDGASVSPGPDTRRILIVDDDDSVRRGLAAYLSDSGYAVIEAENGEAGLEVIRDHPPALTLCDLRMPGMDGLELLERAVRDVPEMPVIVVTGQGVLQDAITALRKGAWDFIAKPVTEMAVLEHAIENALEKAQLLRENRAYRERLEQKVESTETELSANQARLRSVIASFHEAFVLVIDERDRVTAVLGPPQLAERYGLTLEVARAFPLLERVEPEYVKVIREAVHAVRATGEARYCEAPIALDTGDFVFELTISPMLDAKDEQIAVQVFVRDITRRKAAEAEAVKLEAQLRQSQKLEAIGALAGGIAHDFNNILSVIIGFTHMALQDCRDNAPVQEALNEVYAAAHRASGLIRQILTFSRRGVAEKAEIQLAPLVKESVKMLRATLPSTVEFDVDIDPQSGSVLGDPTQINQIMLNLGANAYHAMREQEHGRLRVLLQRVQFEDSQVMTTGTLHPGDYVQLRVADTGCGMDTETLEHVFEPFYTTKPVGEGTGMGLATVHGIVAGGEGVIHLQSKEGAGSTFDIYFPRLSTGTERGVLPMEELESGSGCILFVDDEEKIVDYAEVALTKLGYTVIGCTEPLDALRRFRASPDEYDLIVADQSMPNLTGLGLAAEIRSLGNDVPFVLISGLADVAGDTGRRDELGIYALLQKPIDTFTLAQTVAAALRPA